MRQAVAGVLTMSVGFGLLLLAIVNGTSWQGHTAENERRNSAIVAARNEVAALLSVSAATSDADLDVILEGMTSTFKEQFRSQAEVFRATLAGENVAARAKVTSAGLVRLEGRSAEVVVAATGTVSNKKAKDQERSYTLSVSLQLVAEVWKVSGMEFVR